MASGSVGANENSDLSAPERPLLGEFTKVYTRRFPRRAQLDRDGDEPAAGPAAAELPLAVAPTDAEPTLSTSPARSPSHNHEDVAQSCQQEALAAKDDNFSQQLEEKQPEQSTLRVEAESGPNLRLTEEGRDSGQDVQEDDGERLAPCSQEASLGLQQNDGQETAPIVEENQTKSSGNQASPQLQAPDWKEPISENREELPLRGGNQTPSELRPSSTGEPPIPHGREELPSSGGQEPVSNGREVPEPTCVQEVTSNRKEDLQPSNAQAATCNSVDGRHLLPNGGDEHQLIGEEVPHAIENDRPVNDGAAAVLVNGGPTPVVSRVEDRIRINLSESTSKDVIRGLKRKLVGELDLVRSLVRKLEAKELQFTAYNTSNTNSNASYVGGFGSLGAYSQPHLMRVHSDVGSGVRPQLLRVNSEVGSIGRQESRPFRHLTVSLMENNHRVGEFVEKEKRTPKANQYYRNSEFLLGKDRLPPENNKRFKPNGAGKKHGGGAEYGFGFGIDVDKNREKAFRNCSNLLQRLMKHKHGWVFNEPVDAEKLCIPDYHDIIKHPMDFGTIKTRLSQNLYKTPREFAEDVRLVFRNAMTYNPKGQDVHTMAEELSIIFEERWVVIEKEYYTYQMYYDSGLPLPTPRRVPPPLPTKFLSPVPAPPRSVPPMRTLDRSESMTLPVDPKLKPNFPPVRTPVPKKPKAKDPNKRDMTYEEKQKLSTNLQSLPTEKLDAIVQIIKKRNTALSQHDDEIEVDIDSVDAETLWELDRFVTNYRKSLSKNKRKAELALQARAEAAQAAPIMV